jgi:hypothetical protein
VGSAEGWMRAGVDLEKRRNGWKVHEKRPVVFEYGDYSSRLTEGEGMRRDDRGFNVQQWDICRWNVRQLLLDVFPLLLVLNALPRFFLLHPCSVYSPLSLPASRSPLPLPSSASAPSAPPRYSHPPPHCSCFTIPLSNLLHVSPRICPNSFVEYRRTLLRFFTTARRRRPLPQQNTHAANLNRTGLYQNGIMLALGAHSEGSASILRPEG